MPTDDPPPTDVRVVHNRDVRLSVTVSLVDDTQLSYFRASDWEGHGIVSIRFESGDIGLHVTEPQLLSFIDQLRSARAAMFGLR